ncbi:MAG: biotin transporter BioY [Sphaerochaetaceae bacterium]|nr:biotin transporter BioY [Sphaerochaetaceae bacterium]
MNKNTSLVFVVLFAALIGVCGFISIPFSSGVPIVLQNMMVVLTGLMLGPVYGTLAVGLFLLSGALGLPVFSGGSGGFGSFLGVTGGFLYGYLLAAFVSGLIGKKPHAFEDKKPFIIFLASFIGFAIMYVPGLWHFKTFMGCTLKETFVWCLIPYVPGDLVKVVISSTIAIKLRGKVASIIFPEED